MVDELSEPEGAPLTPESLRRAVENIKDACRVPEPEVKPLRLEDLGPYPEDHPRYGEMLREMLARALADVDLSPGPVELRVREQTDLFSQLPPTVEVVHGGRLLYSFEEPRDFFGIPVVTDATLPPDTWKLRHVDGSTMVGRWPRIAVPGVETLAEALKRVDASPPEMTMPVERVVNGHWLLAQPWFAAGVSLIDHLHASCAPSMVAGLSWRVPANLLPEPHPGAPYLMYHVPVRIDPGLPPGATPYLAFDLEEPTP